MTVFLLKALGFIESLYLRSQKDRIIPYIASGIFYFWAYTVFRQQSHYPVVLTGFILGVFIRFRGTHPQYLFQSKYARPGNGRMVGCISSRGLVEYDDDDLAAGPGYPADGYRLHFPPDPGCPPTPGYVCRDIDCDPGPVHRSPLPAINEEAPSNTGAPRCPVVPNKKGIVNGQYLPTDRSINISYGLLFLKRKIVEDK